MNDVEKIIKTVKISSGSRDAVTTALASVIQEVTLSIHVNGKPLANIACAGIHLKELAAGFLRSEKIIARSTDIEDIGIRENIANVTLKDKKYLPDLSVKNIASSGARGKSHLHLLQPLKSDADFTVKTGLALKLMDELLNGSVVHNQTGGTHCSALAIGKKMIALREDIGRHNTIDMLGGYALLEKINLRKAIILTTGRISSELFIKYGIWAFR